MSILLVLQGFAHASDWQLDPAHTTVTFTARVSRSPVKGTFTNVDGLVQMDDIDPHRSTFEVVVDAASVTTGDAARDEYLRSPMFFDVAKSPKITFKTTNVKKAGKNRYKVAGDLNVRGTSHPIVLTVDGPTPPSTDPQGHMRRSVVARGKINRRVWELGGKAALAHGNATVADDISLEINAVMLLINPGGGLAVQPPSTATTPPTPTPKPPPTR